MSTRATIQTGFKQFISSATHITVLVAGIVGLAVSGAVPLVSAAADPTYVTSTTQISATPIQWSTTNGDILDTVVFTSGVNHYVAIAGNFTAVITPDGVSHAATNFAVLREETGAVVYSGKVNDYPRVVRYYNGILYAGGSFTSFGGQSRARLAALDTTTWNVTSWNPGAANTVWALETGPAGVFYGTGSILRSVSPTTGATLWTDSTTQGAVRAIMLSPGQTSLYVGGLFTSLGGFANHALVRVVPTSGKVDTTFTPALVHNSFTGADGSFDGQNVLALTWDSSYSPPRLTASIGGKYNDLISFDPANSGTKYWSNSLQGDGQDTVTIGDVVIVGTHRSSALNGGTSTSQGAKWFDGAYRTSDGQPIAWDARVSGFQNNADGGNNGIQALAQSSVTKRLYVMGAFTAWDQTCSPANVNSCTGGVPLQSIAVFTYQ